ncbi:MAG: hypothetical protein R3B95_15430 [Nitrospirales bacterium]|nr:hypothetical protein [Nitrospirales bacterium]
MKVVLHRRGLVFAGPDSRFAPLGVIEQVLFRHRYSPQLGCHIFAKGVLIGTGQGGDASSLRWMEYGH